MTNYTKNNIGSGYNTTTSLNAELEKVETAVNSKLDKTGGSLSGDLSMESNDLLNVNHTYTAGLTLNANVITSVSDLGEVTFPSLSSVTYTNTATGAVGRGLQSKLDDTVSVLDFGAVGDGVTDDASAIQAAINSGASGIYFPDGIYKVDTAVTLVSNITMFGHGATIDSSDLGDVFTGTGLSDISVEGLKFIYDTDGSGAAFTIDGCTRVRFSNNYFVSEDNDDTGNTAPIRIREQVGVAGSSDIIVDGNHFKGPRLLLLVQAGSGTPNKKVVISNNTFTNWANQVQSPNILDGIVKVDLYTDDITITGNVCDGDNKVESFIHLEEGITQATIIGNTVKNCQEYGIVLTGGQVPLDINEVIISGNTLKNCSIGVEGLASLSGDWIISNNLISGGGNVGTLPAIDLEFANTGTSVVISGNLIKSPSAEGIFCKSDNAIVEGNRISGCPSYSIYMQDSPDSTVVNNNITDNDSTGLAYVLYMRDSDRGLVANNTINGTATVTSCVGYVGVAEGICQGNLLYMANATYAIQIDGTSDHVSCVTNTTKVGTQAISGASASNDRFGNIELGASVISSIDWRNRWLWVDNTGNLRIHTASPSSETIGTVVGTQT